MTFRTFHSSRVEILRDRLVDDLFAALPADPLAPESVLVDNRVLGDWLNMQVALSQRSCGIAANIHYVQPHDLFWRIARAVLGDAAVPRETPLAKAEMTWKLHGLLADDTLLAQAVMAPVRNYLGGNYQDGNYHDGEHRELKQYQLAAAIADLFDQYAVYRPHWMVDWANGDSAQPQLRKPAVRNRHNEAWQRVLWEKLCEGTSHRAAIEQQLLDVLHHGGDALVARLPMARLSVFGMTSMPPGLVQMLVLLGKHIDVSVYVLDPCEQYWSLIRSARELAKQQQQELNDEHFALLHHELLHHEQGNPLLASQGVQVRDFIRLMQEQDVYDPESLFGSDTDDDGARPQTLLAAIQAQIRELTYKGSNNEPEPLPPRDGNNANCIPSVHVHNCHSVMREVEVLHDQLRDILRRNKDLQPRDIVVMMPRVAPYVAAIHAVFNSAPSAQRIDYHIADRTQVEESPLLESFLQLLQLPRSRLPLSQVLALLEVPALQRRFGIDAEGYATLKQWLESSGVRWGLDAAHRRAVGLPAYAESSWEFALDRLLAGYAVQADTTSTQGLLPVRGALLQPADQVEGSNSELLDSFLRFWNRLCYWREQLDTIAGTRQWAERLRNLLDDFFDARDEQEHAAVRAARESLQVLDDAASKRWFSGTVSLDVVRTVIQPVLEQTSGQNHWREGVKFCSLMPMRGVPFAVVYMLGMNMDDYPRRIDKRSFDLMRSSHWPGDRASRVDDRWLFLEALLSARRYFHASYIGRDIHRNEKREPSVVLSELMDYCRHGFALPHIYLVTEHPLQPFNDRYFRTDVALQSPRLVSFNAEALAIARVRQQGSVTYRNGDQRWHGTRLASDSVHTASMRSFISFFTKPWDWFLQQRHHIYLDVDDASVDDDENFTAGDGLERWQLRDELIKLVNGCNDGDDRVQPHDKLRDSLVDTLVTLRRAEGRWPIGSAGDTAVQALKKLDPDYLWASHNTSVTAITVPIDNALQVECEFQRRGNTVIVHSASTLSDGQRLGLQIHAALAFAAFPELETVSGYFIHMDKSKADVIHYSRADVGERATVLLQQLARYYRDYYNTGLPFEPELSKKLYELRDSASDDEQQEVIEDAWNEDSDWKQGLGKQYRQRSYFGDIEALACASFRRTSEELYAAVNACFPDAAKTGRSKKSKPA